MAVKIIKVLVSELGQVIDDDEGAEEEDGDGEEDEDGEDGEDGEEEGEGEEGAEEEWEDTDHGDPKKLFKNKAEFKDLSDFDFLGEDAEDGNEEEDYKSDPLYPVVLKVRPHHFSLFALCSFVDSPTSPPLDVAGGVLPLPGPDLQIPCALPHRTGAETDHLFCSPQVREEKRRKERKRKKKKKPPKFLPSPFFPHYSL